MLRITPDGESNTTACPDCGNPTRTIWGYIDNDEGAYAVYYAWWRPGHLERGAQLLISIGGWGEGADPSRKRAVGLDSRMGDDRPSFTVVNASELPLASAEFLGKMLSRDEAFESGAATEAFHVRSHHLRRCAAEVFLPPRHLTLRWSGLRPSTLVGYLAWASSGPKPLSLERWATRMYVFTTLTCVGAIVALVDVRRSHPPHRVFGVVLSLFSAVPPLLWFIAGWGMADSGEFEYLRESYRGIYDVATAAAFFAMIGALVSAAIGLTSIVGRVEPAHQRLAVYSLSVPAVALAIAYGGPPAFATIRHDVTAIPGVYFDAADQISLPCVVLSVIVLGMALAIPRTGPVSPN